MSGQDGTDCPGWLNGIRAYGGGWKTYGCKTFTCPPGQYCPDEAYFVGEQGNEPNSACKGDQRVIFELCTSDM